MNQVDKLSMLQREVQLVRVSAFSWQDLYDSETGDVNYAFSAYSNDINEIIRIIIGR